ncbi:MAG: sigma-70 family RNA polymerase sigma factor [Deltaproteobacteria bacterium]|nr:MAG: sigma-70 family RNA polymerase sigma factor [Deltaproteobacteria bacterium]
MEETDENLVKLARNGDDGAFQVLVRRYQRRVFHCCFGLVRNRDDAEDLVQETFVRVYRNLDRFEGSSSFYTWTYRIARNVSIDHLRRANRQRTVDFDDGVAVGDDADDTGLLARPLNINPAAVAGRRELVDKLNEAARSLGDIHREVLMLREVEGLSYQEIADTLEISIGTVMSRLHHARKKMQRALAPYLEGREGAVEESDLEGE